jgi:hypothetical protein
MVSLLGLNDEQIVAALADANDDLKKLVCFCLLLVLILAKKFLYHY